jgi:hypothetical protein
MSKTNDKVEYPSKKIASKFWWSTFAFSFLGELIFYICLRLYVNNATINNDTQALSFISNNEAIISIISIALLIVITFLAELVAIRIVRKKYIIKKAQVNEIATKCLIKWLVYAVVEIVFTIIDGDISLWLALRMTLEVAFGTLHGRKLLMKEAV